jgi:predicted SprT family Zn-dependent metalloprotease
MLLLISCIFIIFYHYFDTKQKNEKPNKNWKKISENYELKEISTGIHIYVSKNKDKNNIYLCPNCFNDKIESFFQFGASIGPAQQLFCPRCHLKLRVNKNDLNSLKTVAKRSSLSSFI